jgi:ecdysteroid 25-hydroxylase
MGMIKYGPKRDVMQNRIMEGIDMCMAEITKFSSKEFDPMHILTNTVGNIVNDFVFGITYDANDETWKHLQYLQEVGVKLVGVGAGANFLPILRYVLKYSIVSTATCLHLLLSHTDFFPSTERT